jgi:HAD superfamily phosphoserine phosphatase-like hydrolase
LAIQDADKPHRLIVFDVEGVLLPEKRYLLFEVGRRLGLWNFMKVLIIGFLYTIWLMPLESTLRRIFALLRGFAFDDLFNFYRRVPLMSGTEEVFKKLKELGHKTVFISSSIPAPFVKDLADRLKADYAFGLDLEVLNGHITGKIGGDVIEPEGKALVLKKILNATGLTPKDCVVVADDRNNLPMFDLCSLRIGYCPGFPVDIKSDFVVNGSLTEILPIITGKVSQASRPSLSRNEALREMIHISGFFVPLVCMYFLDRYLAVLLILLVTLFYTASEFARMEGTYFPPFSMITWKTAITSESYEFATAPIFFALGIMLSLILFPVPVNYASIAIFTLGDGFATLFGKKFGKTVFPFNKGKRMEGSFFGFLFAFLGASFFLADPRKAMVGAAVGMLVESLPSPISDNITIPLASGLALIMLP